MLLHEPPQRRETLVPRVRIHQRPLEPDALQLLDARGSDAPGEPRLAPLLPLQLRRVRRPLPHHPSAKRRIVTETPRHSGVTMDLHKPQHGPITSVPRVGPQVVLSAVVAVVAVVCRCRCPLTLYSRAVWIDGLIAPTAGRFALFALHAAAAAAADLPLSAAARRCRRARLPRALASRPGRGALTLHRPHHATTSTT